MPGAREALREQGPMVQHPDGRILFTAYADCHDLGREPHRFGHTDPGEFFAALSLPQWRDFPSLLLLNTSVATANPPDHTRLRRIVSASFTSRWVESLRALVENRLDTLLEELEDGCFVDQVAFPVTVAVIGELLGIPEADRAAFRPLMTDWMRILDEFDADSFTLSNTAAATITDYMTDLVRQRRRTPGEDLVSAIVSGPEPLEDEEAVAMAALLFSGGFSTTMHLLANALVALLDNPDQADLLRSDPTLAGAAVEEVLRLEPSIQFQHSGRVALADTEVHGVALARGQKITFLLGAALARLEAGVVLPAVITRRPDLALAPGAVRADSLMMRGYETLPVTC